MAAGGMADLPTRTWQAARFQQVVDHFRGRLTFVQVGRDDVGIIPIDGAVNLIGKTDLRDLIRLVYYAEGVVCGASVAMHLSAALETPPGRDVHRHCVVVASGREPAHQQAYPNHHVLRVHGGLTCCLAGACWRDAMPETECDSAPAAGYCVYPVYVESARPMPRCLDLVLASDVIRTIEACLDLDVWVKVRDADAQAKRCPPKAVSVGGRGV